MDVKHVKYMQHNIDKSTCHEIYNINLQMALHMGTSMVYRVILQEQFFFLELGQICHDYFEQTFNRAWNTCTRLRFIQQQRQYDIIMWILFSVTELI